MADMLNSGCTTVNCGIVRSLNIPDPMRPDHNAEVEILRPENHNPHANIVCYYYWDAEATRKVEVTLAVVNKNPYKPVIQSEVYFFYSKTESMHYTSRVYSLDKLPKKYDNILKLLKKAYLLEFGPLKTQ
jgi:hypothetical protein